MIVTPTSGPASSETFSKRCNCQTDSIDGDGALVHQVAVELRGYAHLQPPVAVAQRTSSASIDAGRVHVTLHDVAGEARGGRHGPLQIDARSLGEIAQITALPSVSGARSAANESLEMSTSGQAHAVDRDADTFGEIGKDDGAANPQPCAGGARFEGGDSSELFDDSSEHLMPIGS